MSFLSLDWLVALIATVSLYWLCPGRWRQWLLIAITFLFISLKSPESSVILAVFAITTFYLTRGEKVSGKRALLALVVVFATLAYFKLRLFNAGGRAGDVIANVAIPLGLSYYAFRCAHFIFERYRNTLAQPTFKQYLGYLYFLPTLVVGPINRSKEFFEQTASVTWSPSVLSDGLERILYGYFKVAVLSGFLVTSVLGGFILDLPAEKAALRMYLEIVRDGFNLYFLFAGFSDIAIGFGLLLGIRVMENFNWPYIQKNIGDFWRSWHISLSTWCRDYVYFPVLGATRNPYLATLASFVTIGLWHEISFRYIVWGLYHGVGILIWRMFHERTRAFRMSLQTKPVLRFVVSAASILLTLHFVFLGLVIINQPSFSAVFEVYRIVLLFWI